MEVSISIKKKVALLVITLAIIVMIPKAMDKIRIIKLNDAIDSGDRPTIEKTVSRVSKDDIDAMKSNHPLNNASFHGDIETVILLVEKGIDVNPRDKVENTPLLNALSSNNINRCKIAMYLIAHGADVNAENIYGETALTILIHNDEHSKNVKEETIELFKSLYEKSSIESMFPNEYMGEKNAFDMVAHYDMPELVDWLIEKGDYSYSDIPRDDSGSYLHNYYKKIDSDYIYKCPNMIEYIVNNKLEDINSTNNDGRTILSIAAEMDDIQDCKLFLKLGVNPSIKDNSGKTAYDYATEKNNKEIIELLENY